MLQNYLKMALRHLRKRPAYTFINIAGLALGLACCALMLRYVQDERTFAFDAPCLSSSPRLSPQEQANARLYPGVTSGAGNSYR